MSDSSQFVLRPKGRFDFNSFNEFRNNYDVGLAEPQVRTLVVDLGDVQYIDSAALGILLLLRDKATNAGKQVVLANLRGTVKEVLEIANFHKLFSVR